MTTLTITRPDDWHVHLRDGAALQRTVPDIARYFGRAIVMPNLVDPIVNSAQAAAYRARIIAAQQHCVRQFEPLMTLYLTDHTDAAAMRQAKQAGVVACKLYPAGSTTHSSSGVTDITNIYPVLEAMQREQLLLLIHGEVVDPNVDIFDREKVFIDTTLTTLRRDFPALKIVLEHITTQDAVDYVSQADHHLAATITAHHLLFNRNDMLVGGVRPHYYCLPILKRDSHRQALVSAATSGDPRFFLGSDSAPHSRAHKETACGCAGCYTAYASIELYAQAFAQVQALAALSDFAGGFGADFYGLARNRDTITLQQNTWQAPKSLSFGDEHVVPLCAGEVLQWQVVAS